MRFSRSQFFDSYREQFGQLNQQQVNGLERLLTGIESDPHIPPPPTGVYIASYMLSTVKRETADTFTPIHEYGGHNYFVQRYGGQTRKGRELGNDTPEEGADYAGRGDAQTTGETNYEKSEVALRREYPEVVADFERRTGRIFDLTVGDQPNDKRDPDNMLDPAISYAVLSYGMRTGMWTGRKISQYITSNGPDYFHMREIVNGHDHADEIAQNAKRFERILRDSLISVAPVRLTDGDVDNLVGGIGAQTNSAAAAPFDDLADNPLDLPSEIDTPANDGAGQTTTPPNQQPPTQPPDAGTTETKMIAPLESGGQVSSTVSAVQPSFVQQVQTTITTKLTAITTFLGGLGALGSALMDKAQDFASRNAAIIAGLALVGLAIWYLKSRQDKAHALQLALINTGADPAASTVTIKKVQ